MVMEKTLSGRVVAAGMNVTETTTSQLKQTFRRQVKEITIAVPPRAVS